MQPPMYDFAVTKARTWADYVRAITAGDNGKTVAEKTGHSPSAVSRWKSGALVPDPRQVVTIARAYSRSPLEALIAAGYLTEDEAGIRVEQPRDLALRDFSALDLAREMVRRAGQPGAEMLDQPLDDDHPAMQ